MKFPRNGATAALVLAFLMIALLGFVTFHSSEDSSNGGNVLTTPMTTGRDAEPQTTNLAGVAVEKAADTRDFASVTASYNYAPSLFADTPTGRNLRKFFATVDEFGEDAASNYERAMETLRTDPNTAGELIRAYRRTGIEPTETQYKILYTLGELKAKEALPLLIEVATSPLPPRSQNGNHEHAADEGTLIRMRAIGGLRNLAADGSPTARETLLRVVQESPDLTLRGEAVINYLAASQNVDRDIEFLKAMLPAEQHYLVTTQVKVPMFPTFETTTQ